MTEKNRIKYNFSKLPTYGTVKNDGNYHYLELPKQWHDHKHEFVKFISQNFEIDKSLISKFDKSKNLNNHDFKFELPLAPIGPHISIKEAKLGETVNFKIKDIYETESLYSQIQEYKPALFSSAKRHYVLKWYLLEVELEEKFQLDNNELAHIALACYSAIEK